MGTLTIVPMGAYQADSAAAVAWYPWVGWLFAAVALGFASAASVVCGGPLGSLLVAVVVVGTWAVLSRLMHWDGLADTADGLLGGSTPERRLEIMGDSAVGAFGVVSVALVIAAQIAAVAIVFVSRDWWALGAAPIAGRLAPVICVMMGRAARSEGLGASVAGGAGLGAFVFASLALVATLAGAMTAAPAAVGLAAEHALIAAVAVCSAMVVAIGLARPIGGFTGDTLGASVVIVETVTLVTAAVWILALRGAML